MFVDIYFYSPPQKKVNFCQWKRHTWDMIGLILIGLNFIHSPLSYSISLTLFIPSMGKCSWESNAMFIFIIVLLKYTYYRFQPTFTGMRTTRPVIWSWPLSMFFCFLFFDKQYQGNRKIVCINRKKIFVKMRNKQFQFLNKTIRKIRNGKKY